MQTFVMRVCRREGILVGRRRRTGCRSLRPDCRGRGREKAKEGTGRRVHIRRGRGVGRGTSLEVLEWMSLLKSRLKPGGKGKGKGGYGKESNSSNPSERLRGKYNYG